MISCVFFANVYWLYTEDWSFVTDRVINPGGRAADGAGRVLREHAVHDAGIWLVGLLITIVLGVVIWLAVRLAPAARRARAGGG